VTGTMAKALICSCLLKQSAAVAVPPANESYSWTPAHERVYRTLVGEAAGEGRSGVNLVADTLTNRAVLSGRTPDAEAVRPWQYSVYNPRYGREGAKTVTVNPEFLPKVPKADPAIYSYGSNIANQVVSGRYKPASDNTFYYNPRKVPVTPPWARGQTGTQVGNHLAFKNIAPYIRRK